jgi:CDP-diglyceride synthetase
MDLSKLNLWYVKAAYVALAGLLAIGAIISAFYDMQYLVLVFIIAAALVIVAGSFLFAYLFRHQKVKDMD